MAKTTAGTIRHHVKQIALFTQAHVTESVPSQKAGYQAELIYQDAASIDIAFDRLDYALTLYPWPQNMAIGLQAKLKRGIAIESPKRGLRRSDNWSVVKPASQVAALLIGFGNQIAAIQAFGGRIKELSVHFIYPPKGKKVVRWQIV